MAFKWKRLTLFGLSIGVPALVFFARKIEQDIVRVFEHHRADMATCEHCHRMFDGRAGARWIMHLEDHHKMDLDAAIETTRDIYRQLLIRKADKLQENR